MTQSIKQRRALKAYVNQNRQPLTEQEESRRYTGFSWIWRKLFS